MLNLNGDLRILNRKDCREDGGSMEVKTLFKIISLPKHA